MFEGNEGKLEVVLGTVVGFVIVEVFMSYVTTEMGRVRDSSRWSMTF